MSHRSTREATVSPHLMPGGEELQWATICAPSDADEVFRVRCRGARDETHIIAANATMEKEKGKKRDKRNEKGADEKEKKQKKKKKENKMF